MDLTETSLKLSTTPFSINDILTSNNNTTTHSNHHQHISNRLKQFCRFRRSSLDCFIVSKDEESKPTDASEKNIVQLLNSNPIDMRRRMAGNCCSDFRSSFHLVCAYLYSRWCKHSN